VGLHVVDGADPAGPQILGRKVLEGLLLLKVHQVWFIESVLNVRGLGSKAGVR
jgi:hypothetical protein